MDRNEVIREDTLELTYLRLGEVLRTIDVQAELREIIIVPMRRNGLILGYETTIRWIDRSPAWR